MKKKKLKSQKENRLKIYDDMVDRIYIKVINNSIHIYYRVTHCLLSVSSGEDGEVERLLDLSTKDFVKELIKKGVKVRNKYDKNSPLSNSDEEHWWKGAWKFQTERYLDSIGREMKRDSLTVLVEAYKDQLINKKIKKKPKTKKPKREEVEMSLSERIKRARAKRKRKLNII